MPINKKSAIQKINGRGALLVFPINNQKEPCSLWSEFYPRSKMKWDWDDNGDDRVMRLWMLMKDLSSSGEVVYSKWYRGRATFFSKKVFTALLKTHIDDFENPKLSRTAGHLMDCLESDSPLSTKQLKVLTDLRGRDNERLYTKALQELFNNFLIVAYGEVDDGAFPSLAVGATRHLFEDLCEKAKFLSENEALKILDEAMPMQSLFRKFYERNREKLALGMLE